MRNRYIIGDAVTITNGVCELPIAKRRSITIDKTVNDSINTFRGMLMIGGIEMDYTSTLNIFAEYGIRKIFNTTNLSSLKADPILIEVMKKYAMDDDMKEAGIMDEWTDVIDAKMMKSFRDMLKSHAEGRI